jgi:hypothetical protein
MGTVLVQLGIAGVAVFALWMLAVPDFDDGPRSRANENAAIATLRNIYTAERQFIALSAVDRDGDGKGEAGWFAELAGAVPLRQAAAATDAAAKLAPALLSAAFAKVERGRVRRSGYYFQLHLPTDDGKLVSQGEAGVDASEHAFRVYAWPDGSDGNCRRAFYLDVGGTVWACANEDRRYVGNSHPVPADAAVPEVEESDEAESRVGHDGQTWVQVH